MKTNTILIVLIFLLLCGTLFLSFCNFKQVQLLRQENTILWTKIDSVQQICSKKAALKTNFNYNSNNRDTQTGTITYIFTSK